MILIVEIYKNENQLLAPKKSYRKVGPKKVCWAAKLIKKEW